MGRIFLYIHIGVMIRSDLPRDAQDFLSPPMAMPTGRSLESSSKSPRQFVVFSFISHGIPWDFPRQVKNLMGLSIANICSHRSFCGMPHKMREYRPMGLLRSHQSPLEVLWKTPRKIVLDIPWEPVGSPEGGLSGQRLHIRSRKGFPLKNTSVIPKNIPWEITWDISKGKNAPHVISHVYYHARSHGISHGMSLQVS